VDGLANYSVLAIIFGFWTWTVLLACAWDGRGRSVGSFLQYWLRFIYNKKRCYHSSNHSSTLSRTNSS
jgi:hypothetical protein